MEARQTEFAKVQRAYKQDFVKKLDVSTGRLLIRAPAVSVVWYDDNGTVGKVRATVMLKPFPLFECWNAATTGSAAVFRITTYTLYVTDLALLMFSIDAGISCYRDRRRRGGDLERHVGE